MAILGIDEVGRGPWAGPLVVGAVVLHQPIEGLTDSKKLTSKRRNELSALILKNASCGLGWVSSAELDGIGLSAALRLATRRAVAQIKCPYSEIIIDGTINFLIDTKKGAYVTTLAKADLLIPAVSAASIIAKVARDDYMVRLADDYPGYCFEHHVGYGTAKHRAALIELGPTPEHRKSFAPVAKTLDQIPQNTSQNKRRKKNTTALGILAEAKVADFLESDASHQIIARNWRTARCEIDIVSIKGAQIYFTEVKYRKEVSRGDGFAAITAQKKQDMVYAAKIFLKNHHNIRLQPVLQAAAVSGQDYTINDIIELQDSDLSF